jgi:hypothetical protein
LGLLEILISLSSGWRNIAKHLILWGVGRGQRIDNRFPAAKPFTISSSKEQSAATSEISQKVASASNGAKVVVAVLGEVSGAAAQTRHSEESVLKASQTVEAAANELRKEVEGFLSRVAT